MAYNFIICILFIMNDLFPLLLSFIAGISTVLGSFFILFKIKKVGEFVVFSLSFSLGIMTLISFFDLIPSSYPVIINNYGMLYGIIIFVLIFLLGYQSIKLINDRIKDNDSSLYKIGILSIGEEEGKGNTLVKDTYPHLKEMSEAGRINFVGNIEGKELFINKCNVVVCDGFAGNIALKVTEATASMMLNMISREFKSDIIGCIIGLLAKPFLRRILKRTNWEAFGGMLLLGVNGISVIAHGRSSAYAMKNAVRVAVRMLNKDINAKILEDINK